MNCMHHEHGHHIISFLHNRELNELYISVAIRHFGMSMIGVFVPMYLLQQGFTLQQVFLFVITYAIVHVLLVIPTSHLSSRIGLKHAIFLSTPFLVIFYLLLYSMPQFGWSLYLVAAVYGITKTLFWTSYHLDFSRFSTKKQRGTQIGIVKIIDAVVRTAGPIIGGVMITFIGFKALFATVSVVILASAIPLFFSKDIHEKMPVSYAKIFKGRSWRDVATLFGFGSQVGLMVLIWPLFIFSILGEEYTKIGLVTSLSLLTSIIAMIFVSKFSNQHAKILLRFGSIFQTGMWWVRGLVKTVTQLFVTDGVFGIARPLVYIPFTVRCYDRANQGDRVSYIIFREILINAFFAFFLLVVLLTSMSLQQAIFVGGAAILLFSLY